MSTTPEAEERFEGPPSYENWRAAQRGQSTRGAVEYPLYSDAWFTGELSTGLQPYQFFNLIAIQPVPGISRAAAVLRCELHADFPERDMSKTDQYRYHGGTMADEIAALASLCIGARVRAGGENRRFERNGDPRGRPVAWDFRSEPELAIGIRGRVLPVVGGEHSLMLLERLSSFPTITPLDAVALVRAARFYQDALWIAEAEPSLAWLMLVSAVESAANRWQTEKDSPVDRLRASNPELVEYLDATGVEGLTARAAEEIADSIGSTKKFVEFLLKYVPSPPQKRPAEQGQVSWQHEDLRRAFRLIYGYRSKALHDGIPFPAPMCEPPYRDETWEAVAERPIGLAASVLGGTWLAKDTPMLLHTFEYVARNALLSWWAGLPAA